MKAPRIIYIVLFLTLLVPLITARSIKPAYNVAANRTFDFIEALPEGSNQFGLLFLDYGPGTQAENQPQASVIFEHLLRKKIPTILLTTYALGEKFTKETADKVLARLQLEDPSRQFVYGKDYVILGYRPGANLFLQGISQAQDLATFLGKDIRAIPLKSYESFQGLQTLSQVTVIGEFTGLVGFLNSYMQFLTIQGTTASLIHGCTSITIPETYIYSDTGQLRGTLEGVSGAAYYSYLLQERFTKRTADDSLVINTSLGMGQLYILLLIALGNIIEFARRRTS
jgi:hypothetical protein